MRLRDPYHSDHRVNTAVWHGNSQNQDFLRLEGAVESDICIVGAGFAGTACAYHLIKAGFSVALLEQNQVGWGASGRIGRNVPCLLTSSFEDTPALSALGIKAVSIAKGAAEALGIDLDTENPVSTVRGPIDFLLKQANAALSEGAMIYEDARVKSIHKTAGRFELITDTGKVSASRVIACMGAYGGDLIKAARVFQVPKLKQIQNDGETMGAYLSFNRKSCAQLGMGEEGEYFIQGLGYYGIADAHLCAKALKERFLGNDRYYNMLTQVKHKPYFWRRFSSGL